MAFKKVTAIIQHDLLERVETALEETGITGISVTYIKGYGDYANYFHSPPVVNHAHIEIFTDETKVDSIVSTIMEYAYTGLPGDGLITVMPVEQMYKIKTKSEIKSSMIGI